MKKQTAVEWLVEQVHSDEYTHAFGRTYISIDLIEQAIEMEKQQICNAVNQHYVIPENYYTSTYGS